MAEKVTLSKKERLSVALRSTFLQGSWNYERMQNGGWAFSIIPAIKKLYKTDEERAEALKRHLEFFNTHPYVASPVIGVTLALEEERANGAEVDDAAIQGVKVGMMGPLAGVGDPVFWLVYCTSNSRCSRSFPGNDRKHLRTDLILRTVERDPLGIHVVHTGIRIQSWCKDHRRSFRRTVTESHKRCIYPRYVYPWIAGSAVGIH